jgi:hypothetical protein
MRGGVGKQREDVQHLDKRPRPAMGKDERNRRGTFAALVNEVNVAGAALEAIVVDRAEPFEIALQSKSWIQ